MKKILIVEDEEDAAMLLSTRLEKEGFATVCARDTYSAVELVKKEKPNLVLLDLMLPAGGGVTVLKTIRTGPKDIAATPVVVLTAMHSPGYKEEVTKLGVQGYLEKPYEAKELIAGIKKAMA